MLDPQTPAESTYREAECAVLGAILLRGRIIESAQSVLAPEHFEDLRHNIIYQVMMVMYVDGKPIEYTSVVTELRHSGRLDVIGGEGYLTTLQTFGAPIDWRYYAAIVKEAAGVRRVHDFHLQGLERAKPGSGHTFNELLNTAQSEVNDLADGGSTEGDLRPANTLIWDAVAAIEEATQADGSTIGVPSGLADLDRMTSGFMPGQMIVIAARPGFGKALALDTPLATPTGWTTMGEVQPGELLLGADGKPTRVKAVTEIMAGRPCFEVEFSDGTVIVADAEHQWVTRTRADRRSSTAEAIRTTREIAEQVRVGSDDRANHSIRVAAPLNLPVQDLLIGPYTLGAWLGDGESAGNRLTSETDEIPMFVEAEGYAVRHLGNYAYSVMLAESVEPYGMERACQQCGDAFTPTTRTNITCSRRCGAIVGSAARKSGNPSKQHTCADCGKRATGDYCQTCYLDNHTFTGHLRTLNVLGNKHIPTQYLRASVAQRRALLAGLLDTDGTVGWTGDIHFDTTSAQLAEGTLELITSLGFRPTMSTTRAKGRTEASSTVYRLQFNTDQQVFAMERKTATQKERRAGKVVRTSSRYVTDVRPIDSVPVRCVEVDNADHLYLAGKSMIPTHNSTLGLDLARHATMKYDIPTALFSLEMSAKEIMIRMIAAEARIDMTKLRNGDIGDKEWEDISLRTGKIGAAPLMIDDTASITMSEIKAKARRMQAKHGLGLIVIDYLQLIGSTKAAASREQEVSGISRQVKLLSKELGIPVVIMAQLNRGSETRAGGKPILADLRESGAIEQDADVVMFIHREDKVDENSPRSGEADIIIAKQRNGPTGVIPVAFQGHYSRFMNLSRQEDTAANPFEGAV